MSKKFKKYKVEFSGTVEVSFPEDMAEEVLKGFRGSIGNAKDLSEVASHVAHNVVACDMETFVEGVGPIALNKPGKTKIVGVKYKPWEGNFYEAHAE